MAECAAIVTRPVFLLGMPRSGTSWLSQIFESHAEVCMRFSPNYSYAMKNSMSLTSTSAEWRAHLAKAIESQDEFVTHEFRRNQGDLPRFQKDESAYTRLCVKDTRFHALYLNATKLLPESRVIYIVRHPCACLASWAACKEFSPEDTLQGAWRNGGRRKLEGPGEYWGFDDWCSVTRQYTALRASRPQQIMIVRYEQLLRSPFETTEAMFTFVGLAASHDSEHFLTQSTSLRSENPYSVFKAGQNASAWRSRFPEDITREIEAELAGGDLEVFLGD